MNGESIELGSIGNLKEGLNQEANPSNPFAEFENQGHNEPPQPQQNPQLIQSNSNTPLNLQNNRVQLPPNLNSQSQIQAQNGAFISGIMSPYRSRRNSQEVTEMEESSNDVYIFDDDDAVDNVPLIGDNPIVPRPRVDALIKAAGFYLRFGLGIIFLSYSCWLLFNRDSNYCWYEKNTAGDDEKKCRYQKYSHSPLRIVFSVVILLLLDPFKCSIILNFFHRKQMLQLQVTLVLWIVFIINNAEDGRSEEPSLSRFLKDAFYGFSKARIQRLLVNLSYFIFDLVLYPNSIYFTTMIILFFFLVVGLLTITLLNYLELTNINVDFLAGGDNGHMIGLTDNEMGKLEKGNYDNQREPGQIDDPNDYNQGATCAICYENFERGVQITYIPQCNHFFHPGCIEVWLKSKPTCPLCRLDVKEVVKEDPDENPNEYLLNSSMFEIDDV